MKYPVFLFLPTQKAILSFEPGTGDQLLQEDIDAGFNNYLNWSLKALNGDTELMDDPEDGGMVLFNDTKQTYLEDPLSAIPAVLSEAIGAPAAPYVILDEQNAENRGEISTMVTISSGHVRETTMDLLDKEPETNELWLTVYPKDDFGWYIYITDMKLKDIQDALKYQISECAEIDNKLLACKDLLACILFAREQGADVLCLDSDGPVVDGLETY